MAHEYHLDLQILPLDHVRANIVSDTFANQGHAAAQNELQNLRVEKNNGPLHTLYALGHSAVEKGQGKAAAASFHHGAMLTRGLIRQARRGISPDTPLPILGESDGEALSHSVADKLDLITWNHELYGVADADIPDEDILSASQWLHETYAPHLVAEPDIQDHFITYQKRTEREHAPDQIAAFAGAALMTAALRTAILRSGTSS